MLKTAIRACKEAGKTALKHFDKKIRVRNKGKFDLVTNIDVLCEKKIIERTRKKYMGKQFRDYKKISKHIMGLRITNASSLDLAYIAAGRFDAYLKTNIRYNEYAAGSVLIKEAGGKITNLKRKDFSNKTKSLLISNGRIHDKLLKIL